MNQQNDKPDESSSKKKKGIILGIACLAIAGIVYAVSAGTGPEPEKVMTEYLDHWEKGKYDAMYSLLSQETKEKLNKKSFIKQHQEIKQELKQEKIQFKVKKGDQSESISYKTRIQSGFVGEISFSTQGNMVKESEGWKVQWTPSMIIPQMAQGDRVKVNRLMTGERGEITARNGEPLAVNKKKVSVGLIPGRVLDLKKTSHLLGEELGINPSDIIKKAEAGAKKDPDAFIPFKTWSGKEVEKAKGLENKPGVTVQDTSSRVYPQKDLTAHVTGYIRPIKEEQLKKRKGQGYLPNDWLGQSGLEEEMEDHLRAKPGYQVMVVNSKGQQKKVVAEKPSKNGEDIQVTIDLKMQKQLYQGIKNDKGAAVALHPDNGDVLAMVSTPSYDPNSFITGLSQSEWQRISGASQPLANRAKVPYSPGSTLKSLTAAIALDTKTVTPETVYNTDNPSWQKDSSWGGYFVRRVNNPGGGVDMGKALAWSDNIYFARVGLKIGEDKMITYLKKFGFGEKMDFPLTITPSQYANEKKFNNEILLADTSYGQGQLLISPLHLAATYTTFTNNGDMLKPQLLMEKGKENKPVIWRKNVFSSQVAQTVNELLTGVVTQPKGSARDLRTKGVRLGAKTGTAELKASRDAKEQRQLGWLSWIAGKENEKPDIVVAMMVDEVQDRGGSHYLFPTVKKILTERY